MFQYGDGAPVDPSEIRRIRDAMRHRGPDGQGAWASADGRVLLGHRRLSILDLSSTGAQPMTHGDGRSWIVFNGEIYNYRDLRAELESRGRSFASSSDTEVLLQLYEEAGLEMFCRLRGMYAFALWDGMRQRLVLARDPFGIKPLYYADDGNTIRAASQVKALLAGGGVDREPDWAGHVGFFIWGHVPEPHTLYRSIRSLPAGSYLAVERHGRHQRHSFCVPRQIIQAAATSGQVTDSSDRRGALRRAVSGSVRYHLISDVPVGVFLSSGIDSASVAALASEAGAQQLTAVTLGFQEFRGTARDETPLAEDLAKRYGFRHRTYWVSQDEFSADLDRILEAMDQPTIDGINTYFVSKAAAACGLKVALSGLGGDELFGGYATFSRVPAMARFGAGNMLWHKTPRALRSAVRGLLSRSANPKWAALPEYVGTYGGSYLLNRCLFLPSEIPGELGREVFERGWHELDLLDQLNDTVKGIRGRRARVAALEMSWYMRNQLLRDSDWAGMGHSVEIRVPLVDMELLLRIAPLLAAPKPVSKRDLAATPIRPLPAQIIARRKTGFGIPVERWFADAPVRSRRDRGLQRWARFIYGRFTGAPGRAELFEYSQPFAQPGVTSAEARFSRN